MQRRRVLAELDLAPLDLVAQVILDLLRELVGRRLGSPAPAHARDQQQDERDRVQKVLMHHWLMLGGGGVAFSTGHHFTARRWTRQPAGRFLPGISRSS